MEENKEKMKLKETRLKLNEMMERLKKEKG